MISADSNFCTYRWSTTAAPDYAVLHDAALDGLGVFRDSVGEAPFTDPLYADCTGKGQLTPEATVKATFATTTDDNICLDAGVGVPCDPHNHMPQCPSCVTVTPTHVMATVPDVLLKPGTTSIALDMERTNGTWSTGTLAIKRAPGAGVTVVSVPLASKDAGKLKTGSYSIRLQ